MKEHGLLDKTRSLSFLEEVIEGLSEDAKRLPCKYLYDERGSQLFDQICELEEYYLTRTELWIMEHSIDEMVDAVGSNAMLVEFGSGSSIKTRLLLEHLQSPAAYVPVDISTDHLQATVDKLRRQFPQTKIIPAFADFTEDFTLPLLDPPEDQRTVYFPGSTIGNFPPPEARRLLDQIVRLCDEHGGLLIGVDLQKDGQVLEAAYNDAKGVTAEFNINILRRINRELGADFDLDQFQHRAIYSEAEGRIEIYLVSLCDQVVTIGETTFEFLEGESICTEYSYKHTIAGFSEMADQAGLTLQQTWTDPQQYFGVLYFETKS